MSTEHKQNLIAVWISLISNILLTIIKLVVGFLAKSQVLIADGVHNAGDVIATGTALVSMRISKIPADEDHPYGHGKAEVLGSGAVAIILALAALYVAYQSIRALFEPAQPATSIALLVAIVSLIWKQALYVYTIRFRRRLMSIIRGINPRSIQKL